MQKPDQKLNQEQYDKLNTVTSLIPLAFILLFAVSYFVLVYAIGAKVTDLLGMMFLVYFPITLGALIAYFIQLTTHSRKNTHLMLILTLSFSFLLCAALLGEGVICIIIASPILYMMMWVGSGWGHFICEKFWRSNTMLSVAFVPFIMMLVPSDETVYDSQKNYNIIINASPQQVWQSINNISEINPSEFPNSWSAKIGVPMPLSATTVATNETSTSLVRKCRWHKNIWFDEPVTEFIPNKKLSWYFKFYPTSVPKGALDDHVTINGKHFKLLTASYELEELSNQRTKLIFNVHYQVITDMNWYSGWWADFFMDDFAENVLQLYKNRLETSNQKTLCELNSPNDIK